MSTPAERLAELMASPEIPTIAEYAQALADTFPPITEAPEEPRRILRAAYKQQMQSAAVRG